MSCTECSQDCRQDLWNNAPKTVQSEKCGAGKRWFDCLDQLKLARCPGFDFPVELADLEMECDGGGKTFFAA